METSKPQQQNPAMENGETSAATLPERSRSAGDYMFRILKKTGFLEMRQDDENLNEFLDKMGLDQFKNYLSRLNIIARDLPRNQSARAEFMSIGNFFSPSQEVQDASLDKALVALKSIPDNDEKAALMYYLINDLHMFSDGNGRTSRLVFELITVDGDISKERLETLINHKSDSDMGSEGRKAIGEKLPDVESVNQIVMKDMLKNTEPMSGLLQRFPGGFVTSSVSFDSNNVSAGVVISKQAQVDLSIDEQLKAKRAISEGNFFGGFTMALLVNRGKRGILRGAEKRGDRVSFWVGNEGDGNEMMESLTADDYRDAIKAHDFLKTKFMETLIDVFIHPDQHTFGQDQTIKDVIMKNMSAH